MPQVSKIVRMTETDRRKFQALYDRLPKDVTEILRQTPPLFSETAVSPDWRFSTVK